MTSRSESSPSASTACVLDDLRVPSDELARRARRRARADLRDALERAAEGIADFHASERRAASDLRARRHRRAHDPGARRPRRLLRAGRARDLSVDRADDRDPGAGRGRRRGRRCACRPIARRARSPPATLAAAAIAGRRRGLRDRRRAGDRRDGLRHRVDRAGRRHRRARATSTSRSRSARSPAKVSSASRRRSPGRRRSSSSPTTPTPVERAAIDVDRAGRARSATGSRGSSPGQRRRPTRSTRRSTASSSVRPAAPTSRRRSREGGYVVLVDGPEQAMAVANADRARAPRAHVRRSRGARAAGAPRGCGVLRTVGAGVDRRLHRRPEPRAADVRLGAVRPGAHRRATSRSRCTSSRSTRPRSARSRPTSPLLAEAEGLDAHAESVRIRTDRGADDDGAAISRPRVSDDLRALEGYHSPQVDVEVRLNTNESPEPPPAAWTDALRRPSSAASTGTAIPTAPPPSCAARSPTCTASPPIRSSRPTGRTRCCRRCSSPTAARARAAAVFEPTYALHATSRGSPAPTVVEGERTARLRRSTSTRCAAVDRRGAARRSRSSARPNNPTGMVETEATVRAVLRRGRARRLVVVDEAYGQFAPWSALDAGRRGRPARRHPHVLEDVVDGRGPARLPRRPVVARRPSSTRSCCRTTSTRSSRSPACSRSTFVDEMEERVARVVEERGRLVAGAVRPAASTCGRRARTSCSSGPRAATADEVWQALLDRSVLVRNCASWPRLDGCLRVTVGTPRRE